MNAKLSENNPLIYQNTSHKLLDEARNLFLIYLKEFAEQKQLSVKDIQLIKDFVEQAYIEKKCSLIINEKLSDFSNYFNNALTLALKNQQESDMSKYHFSKCFYLKNRRKEVCYEQR
jgi:hypothetical protein